MSLKSLLSRLESTFHYTITSTGYDAAKERFTYKVTLNGQTFDYFHWLAQPGATPSPDLSDIIECLLSDCNAGAQSFEDFTSELGYDPDSHSARQTHQACRETLCKMVAALGFETLAKLEQAAQDSDDSA